MKIVSPFKDYYDCMMRTQYSATPLYIRETKVLEHNSGLFPKLSTKKYNRHFNIGCGFLSFCGIKYPFIRVYDYDKYVTYWSEDTFPYADDFYTKEYYNFEYNSYNSFLKNETIKEDINAQYNCPIVINEWTRPTYPQYELIANPNLSLINFQKIKNPIEAFTEIERWLSNQANPEPIIPTVSNNDMIQAKGFDLKYSFRKESTKKRK